MVNRHRHGLRIFSYFIVELAVLAGAFFVAYWARQETSRVWGRGLEPLESYLWLLPLWLCLWAALLWALNSYLAFRSRSLLWHGFMLGAIGALSVLGMFSLLTVLKEHDVNRSFIGVLGVISFLLLLATRSASMAFLLHYTQKGYDRHYVLIAGTSPAAVGLAEELEGIRGAVYQVRGFVTEEPEAVGQVVGRWKVLGRLEDLPALASLEPVDEVYILPRDERLETYYRTVAQCEAMGITVHLRLSPYERLLSRVEVHQAGDGSYLTFTTAPRSAVQLAVKRFLDVSGALGMLALLWPLLAVVAFLVKATSRGPVIFRQDRAGMNGRVFTLYKFRTMYDGADRERPELEDRNEMDGPAFKIKDDPRVTWLGRLLRRTSIDELPQLWNVLKGDMSLVGPRPLPVYEVEKFERWQRRRMSMRPGITCLWQVSGRNRVTSFAEWMKLDLEYVDRWSLGLDLKILAKTLPAVFGGKGAY
jgi:exopolysaccharide biosynthesis polyprenyl glycosylphosphotransferase